MSDICGETPDPPRHAHAFGDLARLHEQMYTERAAALKEFHEESKALRFPYPEQALHMHPGEEDKLREALDSI